MLNTIRANTPSKPVPERPCLFSNTLTLLSTFLTEQDDEEHDQLHLLMFRLPVPHSVLVFWPVRDFDFIVNIHLVPHASRIVAHIVSTWLLSFGRPSLGVTNKIDMLASRSALFNCGADHPHCACPHARDLITSSASFSFASDSMVVLRRCYLHYPHCVSSFLRTS
jgi:hypothetical protein